MMTVIELARQGHTTPHAVRHYTRMGLLQPERHPRNGYRLYETGEITRLRFIRQAKQLGYTLNEIRQIMREAEQGRSPCTRVREILLRRIDENRDRLKKMAALQERMELAWKQWAELADDVPSGEQSVCHLIESFGSAVNG